jgi:protein O-GlcNAc transferase
LILAYGELMDSPNTTAKMRSVNIKSLFKRASDAFEAGNLVHAKAICENLLTRALNHPDGLNLLGVIVCRLGDPAAGIVHIAKASAASPNDSSFLNNLGTGLSQLGRDQNALLSYQRVLELEPNHSIAHNNIATIYHKIGHLNLAVNHFLLAISLQPDYVEALSNYGNTLLDMGDLEQASKVLEKAVTLNPKYSNAQNNLGVVRQRQGRYWDAEQIFWITVKVNPAFADPYVNLAEVYKETGRVDEAKEFYKKALQLAPGSPSVHSNYLFALNNLSSISSKELYEDHTKWGQMNKPAQIYHPPRLKNKNRKLKIGYVSPDFRRHSVSYFLEALFANHNHQKFEITCYSNAIIEDEVTTRLQKYVNKWRSIFGVSDAEAAQLIGGDKIDILVDLSGHTMGNRLELFALKPAPIQVSYLGYPATTGLSAIDYRITDNNTDPVGASDLVHTEKLLRLKGGFLCYQPPANAPNVGISPFIKKGYVTFGSCNNLTKLTPQVTSVWAQILRNVPKSKLLLKSKPLGDETVKTRIIDAFKAVGIAADRLDLRPWITERSPLSIYNEIDIALDPFPYNGTTTLCETLWMGVPTVVLEGDRHAGRVGHSLNWMVGLQDWSASSLCEYVDIAVSSSKDYTRLKEVRRMLRDKTKKSVLCDGLKFARKLEKAYNEMWQNKCHQA